MDKDALTQKIIGAAIEVHRHLGPGLLESTYEACLLHELKLRKMRVERQVMLPVVYKEIQLDQGYRIDLLVEREIIVELKVVDALTDVHKAQVLSYLQHAGKKCGLLFNFNVKILSQGGIRRLSRDHQI